MRSEASCASAVRTARAVSEEAGPHVAPALRQLAGRSEKHAEKAVHKVCQEYDLALPVPLTQVKLGAARTPFHVILPSSWFQLMMTLGILWFVWHVLRSSARGGSDSIPAAKEYQ